MNKTPCPKIDKTKVDIDGIPFCPIEVIKYNAYQVFRCAFAQAKRELWKSPTPDQIKNIETVIQCFYNSYTNGITKENSSLLMSSADAIGLQCCRAKNETGDSYILLYTKPGIRNYNGPFMMLREKNASNVVIVSPHDGSDRTIIDTKVAFKNSKALAVISNGHKKWSREADFSKTRNNLGNYALRKLADLFKRTVILNIHSMVHSDYIMIRSRFPPLAKVFEDSFKKYTSIQTIKPFNAWYDIDTINTPYQLKTEIPAVVHGTKPEVIGKIICDIEKNKWAWASDIATLAITDDSFDNLPNTDSDTESDTDESEH